MLISFKGATYVYSKCTLYVVSMDGFPHICTHVNNVLHMYVHTYCTDSNGQSLRARTSSNTHICCSAADDGQKWERRDCGRRRGEWIRADTA